MQATVDNAKAIRVTRSRFFDKFHEASPVVQRKVIRSLGRAQFADIMADRALNIAHLSAMIRAIRWLDDPKLLDVQEIVEFELEDGSIGRVTITR